MKKGTSKTLIDAAMLALYVSMIIFGSYRIGYMDAESEKEKEYKAVIEKKDSEMMDLFEEYVTTTHNLVEEINNLEGIECPENFE